MSLLEVAVLAHIGGLPVEETVAYALPVLLLGAPALLAGAARVKERMLRRESGRGEAARGGLGARGAAGGGEAC
ncbi:hypothetical protein VSS74_17380 [Conexibacter stalactiti]|uniref:Uncharacterized protein n=1 Tax=Conexibacter stalactiti TaxID=1940611 RepID=A0ABU4HS28_9ACTN|nr:hypothetical protein [Conexibacter stalactiti]MDW5596123.1 hypothetical protein [Conexibacter stalactiti]MEC5036765.1 hypothetical protein [Conexibacter stalactiti]